MAETQISQPLPNFPTRSGSHDGARDSVGTVYAKAFLGALAGKPEAEESLRELGSFVVEVLGKDPKIASVFSSLRISTSDMAAMLDRSFKGRITEHNFRLLHVLNRHGRLGYLRSVYIAARQQWNHQQGIMDVGVTTASPLDDRQAEGIRQSLASKLGHAVELQLHVDPSILGGIQIRVGDTVYDASVTQQLRTLREEAVASVVAKIRAQREKFVSDSTGMSATSS
jgi:F-type H+-transporting ATPase subunit delta